MTIHIQRVTIVGGGNVSAALLPAAGDNDYVIGVDRGAHCLIQHGIVPNIAIGDFDSVSAAELRVIRQKTKRVEEHPKEKDATDMELAVEHAISLQPKEVVIYGALGDRLDHTMGNLHLLERLLKEGIPGVIRDINNEVKIVSGRLIVKKEACYRYVSILPITESIEVTLKGFTYDVFHASIHRGQTVGISNEIREDQAMIEVHRGKALIVRSRD